MTFRCRPSPTARLRYERGGNGVGHVEGRRAAAVLDAILAGGFFFAALQVTRAAG
jgi:hypothetical protein